MTRRAALPRAAAAQCSACITCSCMSGVSGQLGMSGVLQLVAGHVPARWRRGGTKDSKWDMGTRAPRAAAAGDATWLGTGTSASCCCSAAGSTFHPPPRLLLTPSRRRLRNFRVYTSIFAAARGSALRGPARPSAPSPAEVTLPSRAIVKVRDASAVPRARLSPMLSQDMFHRRPAQGTYRRMDGL